jgi:hypothetical protein
MLTVTIVGFRTVLRSEFGMRRGGAR